jgi:hypothetical protein
MPTYDVSDGVAPVAKADVSTAWAALMGVDLIEVGRRRPLVGMLGALRALPEVVSNLLHGEPPERPPERMRLRDMPDLPADGGGWTLLGERPEDEIALGLVGYWTYGVGSGAHVLVNGLLDAAREDAEARQGSR